MNRYELAEKLREAAGLVSAGFEVDRGGITIADAIAALRQIDEDEYFKLELNIHCHSTGEPKAEWSVYGFSRPKTTFKAKSLAALVEAVRSHAGDPATVDEVSGEVGRDSCVPI